MQVPEYEGRLFSHLYGEFMRFGNQRLEIADDEGLDIRFERMPADVRARIRDAVWTHPELLEQFIRDNPSHLTSAELALMSTWRHRVVGTFHVYRYLKTCTIFLDEDANGHAFGVLGLADPIDKVLEQWPLPAVVRTALLPLGEKIVYDGLMYRYSILADSGVTAQLDKRYRKIKSLEGIITSLPAPDFHVRRRPARKAVAAHNGHSGRKRRKQKARS
ncbi:MAG: hypothetical protein HY000_38005 [Planctomycetes bacterium]|nr:hypothetical protein [Planctomycetia bacterium]MBI3468834.1 hypothetical protein [Planctomycetota bacterium]